VKQAITIHLRDPPGDILIFMTGQDWVEYTYRWCRGPASHGSLNGRQYLPARGKVPALDAPLSTCILSMVLQLPHHLAARQGSDWAGGDEQMLLYKCCIAEAAPSISSIYTSMVSTLPIPVTCPYVPYLQARRRLRRPATRSWSGWSTCAPGGSRCLSCWCSPSTRHCPRICRQVAASMAPLFSCHHLVPSVITCATLGLHGCMRSRISWVARCA
jgi:hypothetical protein